MSFPPPGPPMPMPGMPPVPPMMPPPYHPVPPMVLFSGGMIPMTVGMMPAPMMAPVAMAVPPSLPMPPHPKSPMKKHMPPMPYKRHEWMNKLREYNKKGYSTTLQSQTPKGPPVTVFVGNITERASDSLIRQILQRCGTVVNWKRVQGANGKLQAFGFCEYGDPESGLRAIRLLHEWQIGEKKLVVKVDAKTKEKLDEYKATKWANQNKETTAAAAAAAATTTTTTENSEEKKVEETDDKNDEIDENTKKEDLIIKASIEDILRDHSVELSRPVESKDTDTVEPENHMGWLNSFSDKRILKSYQLRKLFTLSQTNSTTNKETPPVEKPRKSSTKSQETTSKSREDNTRESKNGLDEMDLEEEKKSLIHREIDKFRDTYKRAEEEKEKERERKERDSSRESSRSRHREYRDKERKSSSRRERTPVRDREREREAERARERERERERTRSPVERIRGKDKIERIMARSRSRSRDRAWSQERERSSRERSRDKDVDKDREDEEDAYDRKKMDRKLREKEAAYQERLRNWEQRERRKAKDYEKSRQKEDDQKQEELKEARRLKEFLEDYDDERDDPKYYKGSALARRLKEREKEIEADNHDRRKEKEELEELRRQLVEKGHPDPDGELERLHQEEQAKLLQSKAKVEPSDSEGEPEPPVQLPKMKPIVKQEVVEEETKPAPTTKHPLEDENTQNSLSGFSDVITTQEEAKPLGFGVLRLGGSPTQVTRSPSTTTTNTTTNSTQSGQKKKISLQDVFNDDDSGEQRKKRKLIPLDDVLEEETAKLTGTSQQNMSTEEKRKHIKNLIDKIPTAKEELFAFTLDWSLVDKPLMERKIKPWINKKIVEYIGEEEPTLVDFICSKVLAGSAAQSILDDVSMVLDEEAEVFVVKMWRLLIYEIEAKKLGLMR